ncbi:MAG: ThuA domain-containing protein [Blastocatellia bacterium]|nr:ThuA domain-containing protein [Blastocatellia bacterium]
MRKIVLFSLLAVGAFGALAATQRPLWKPKAKDAGAIRALLVTGGHDHDVEFYSAFDDAGIRTIVDPHPTVFGGDIRKRADVLVLYDMMKTLDEKRRANVRSFVESGKGVVVLHHAIGDNVDWPWWHEEVVGGRYLFEAVNGRQSSYRHDEEQTIRVTLDHPITRGLGTFRILDETYKDLWISPRVKVLLRSDNPTSDGPVAWISPYEKSRVVYIQLGHDRNANLNPNFRRLVQNAVYWAAGKTNTRN